MQYGYSLGDCVKTSKFPATAVENSFDFHFDGKSFWTNIAVRKQSAGAAAGLAAYLNSGLELYSRNADSPIRKSIVANTSFTAADGQVFIVTRLPRGSLDTLLASNAK